MIILILVTDDPNAVEAIANVTDDPVAVDSINNAVEIDRPVTVTAVGHGDTTAYLTDADVRRK